MSLKSKICMKGRLLALWPIYVFRKDELIMALWAQSVVVQNLSDEARDRVVKQLKTFKCKILGILILSL